MASKVSADKVLTDAASIEKVWKANSDLKLGKNPNTVALADYQASIKAVNDFNTQIEDLRSQLNGLLDNRDDAALELSGYNTRALSAIRGIYGPDSSEYDQAGGTRTSERKTPVRTKASAAKTA
jgi:hypothetical protein